MGEVTAIAYRFHWSLDDLLDLEHDLRRTFLDQIHRLEAAGG